MRRWGILITVLYAVILCGLLVPLAYRLAGLQDISFDLALEGLPIWLTYVLPLIGGQAALIFISVDTGWQRLRPRLRASYSAVLAGMLTGLLVAGFGWSLAAAAFGESAIPEKGATVLWILLALWLSWAAIFYAYYVFRDAALAVRLSWLLKGSVLELLVAVPCHIIVRNRGDCSAPAATSFGIVTGIAVMLMCFGPGVLALYKRRLEQYKRRPGQ